MSYFGRRQSLITYWVEWTVHPKADGMALIPGTWLNGPLFSQDKGEGR